MAMAYHQRKDKIHGSTRWTRAAMEPIMQDIRNRMSRREVALKHNISEVVLKRKIIAYNNGELL